MDNEALAKDLAELINMRKAVEAEQKVVLRSFRNRIKQLRSEAEDMAEEIKHGQESLL